MITPAISVMSAIEGLKVVEPALGDWVVPITAVITRGAVHGSAPWHGAVGRFFGPVMILWFVAIGACGVNGIIDEPEILRALSPTYALSFMFGHFHIAFFALAAVVLAVTGAEALYADMGHFGRKPITLAWLFIVLPACVLNYFGQGALILGDEQRRARRSSCSSRIGRKSPWCCWPRPRPLSRHKLSSPAHFRWRRQAAKLGICRGSGSCTPPSRRSARSTSDDQPSADGLGAHPGVRVPQLRGARLRIRDGGHRDHHHRHAAVLLPRPKEVARPLWHIVIGGGSLLTVDLLFLAANLTKLVHGAWLPLLIAVTALTVMTTWERGREIVTERGRSRRTASSVRRSAGPRSATVSRTQGRRFS